MKKRFDAKFATKDDLVAMEKRFDAKFATKDDLKKFATKDDLNRFATKNDLKQMKKEIIDDIADMIENKIVKILNEHEMRLDRLEKRVGGFPPIA